MYFFSLSILFHCCTMRLIADWNLLSLILFNIWFLVLYINVFFVSFLLVYFILLSFARVFILIVWCIAAIRLHIFNFNLECGSLIRCDCVWDFSVWSAIFFVSFLLHSYFTLGISLIFFIFVIKLVLFIAEGNDFLRL